MIRVGLLWRREMAAWRLTAFHYVLPVGVLVLCGGVFVEAMVLGGSRGGSAALALFGSLPFWLSVIVAGAAVGGSLLAEDRDPPGAWDVLWSSPVTVGEVVLARMGAAWVWLALAYLPTVLLFVALSMLAPQAAGVDVGALAAAYLSLALALAVLVAGGALASVLVRRRGPAVAIVSLTALALLFAVGSQGDLATWETPLRAFRLPESHHLSRFATGAVDLRYVIGYGAAALWLGWAAALVLEGRWRRGPRGRMPMTVALGLGAVLGAMVVYVAARHPVTLRLTDTRFQVVSPRSLDLLKRVDAPLSLTFVCRARDPLFSIVRKASLEIRAALPQVRVDTADPDRDLAAVRELARRSGLTSAPALVAAHGPYAVVAPLAGGGSRVPGAGGDEARPDPQAVDSAVAAAAVRLLQPLAVTVGFVTGHGERDPEDDRIGGGMAAVARLLRQEDITVRRVRLGTAEPDRADVRALIVAGPQRDYAAPERDALNAFLQDGGRALFLLDADGGGGLADLLAAWGVRLSGQVVFERLPGAPLRDRGRGMPVGSAREVVADRYGDHPVTRRLAGLVTVLPRPQVVEAAVGSVATNAGEARDLADRPVVTPLVFSSSSSWAETDDEQEPPRFDADEDRPGPLPLAVAVERGARAGLDMHLPPTRLVVVGDSAFAANGGLAGANADFFLNAVNWLVDRERLLDVPPLPRQRAEVRLTPRQELALWVVALGLVPAVPLLIGVAVGVMRRDRRRRPEAPRS